MVVAEASQRVKGAADSIRPRCRRRPGGEVVKALWIGFRKGVRLAGECLDWPWSGRLPMALAALLLVGLAGCIDRGTDSWWAQDTGVVYEANGFRFTTYGPRETGFAPDQFPALDAGLVTVDEIGAALEREACELAARTGLDPEGAVAQLRALEIRLVDDYNFELQGRWASGMYTGRIYAALWGRREADSLADIPIEAPSWTVRAPGGGADRWRYGARALVPATDHELGHHFFGPNFEH